MDSEMTIIDGQEYSGGQESIASKKIKVNDEKKANIEKKRIKFLKATQIDNDFASLNRFDKIEEKPVMEEVAAQEDLKVDFPVFEKMPNAESPKEPVIEETVSEEPMTFAFASEGAYGANKAKDEISEAQEDHIRGLGDSYRGHPKSELNKVISGTHKKVESEDENISEKVDELLEREYYSPKISQYMTMIKQERDSISAKIENNAKEIESVTNLYRTITKKGEDLQSDLLDSQNVMNKINDSELVRFLSDRKDEKSISLFKSIEELFDVNRANSISTNNKIRENDEHKKEISNDEKVIRARGEELRKSLKQFDKDNYSKLAELKEKDNKLRELNNSVTEVTGIMNKEIMTNDREVVTNISNMETPAMNRFESLREHSVINEPKTVIGITPFNNDEQNRNMSFGRGTL